jgi:hypothetical protein
MPIRSTLMAAVAISLVTPGREFGAQVRVTGTFTDLHYSQESGDLLGLELLIVPAQGDQSGYVAFVQLAEGGGPFSVVVPLEVKGDKVGFSMPSNEGHAGLSFSGVVSNEKLTGTWSNGNREVLKRHASYWD